MKKNDFATFIVYVGMIAIALLVGLLVIKPIMDTYGASLPINSILIMVLGLFAGAILNSVLLELGHILGAKAGKYEILKCVVLGVGVSRAHGKKKFGFYSYEGLTGETKVAPKDVKNSNLSAYILFPVLFLFVEFIVAMVLIVYCQNTEASNPSIAWLHIFMATILASGGIVFLYDLFPAHIESVTDGYLLVLLAKPANKEAYNNMLVAEACAFEGKDIPEVPVYTELTDFTASLNLLSVYRHLTDGEPDKALPIVEPVLAEGATVSSATKLRFETLKLAILLEREDRAKAKKMYEELSDESKKHITSLASLTELRAYLLIASFIEGSESEANYAIDKAEKLIKACDPNYKEAEKSLLQYDVDMTRSAHPSWDIYKLPWEEKEENKAK